MGRKKVKRTGIKKRRTGTMTNKFDCPKCNHEKVVSCKIDNKNSVGTATCSVCDSHYKCSVSKLDQFVDVYHNWVDELI